MDIDIALNDYLVPISFLFIIIVSLYMAFVNKKLLKEQYALLKECVGKYHLQITLHDIRKTHTKKCNKLFFFVILFYAIEIGIINLLDFTVDISEDLISNLFLGGFGLFILLIIVAFILAYKSYRKIRQEMILIENELDNLIYEESMDIE